ncbi:hypothetical protein NKR23_g9412 [Pleurostoma richardsiae]|uniref:NADPH-dependent FMN reductase-like domain-containing protein n=1 Tax=Pleurostoma richardsiae TaxID=41990 RepID=A0AA38R644_9PEZI|nr:hypothetical protein NKR23_g9412 [Pleurostoma richardsiae]
MTSDTPDTPKSVAVIITSVRAVRVGPHVAEYVTEVIKSDAEVSSISLTAVDLAAFELPVYNEAPAPAMVPEKAQFVHEHTRRWSAEIQKYDGYVMVIQEYNYGVAGATKNAIDYLLNEWKGKPVAVISYGIYGGATANEQVSYSLGRMGLRVVETKPKLGFAGAAGPDLFLAMGEGKLGEDTKKEWDEKQKGEILKAWGELKDELSKVEGTQPLPK